MILEFKTAIPYKINIVPSHNNGFIVKVGCSTTVFETADSMLAAIKEYIENPVEAEKHYNSSCSQDSIEEYDSACNPQSCNTTN